VSIYGELGASIVTADPQAVATVPGITRSAERRRCGCSASPHTRWDRPAQAGSSAVPFPSTDNIRFWGSVRRIETAGARDPLPALAGKRPAGPKNGAHIASTACLVLATVNLAHLQS
jgi:hypothetical protein